MCLPLLAYIGLAISIPGGCSAASLGTSTYLTPYPQQRHKPAKATSKNRAVPPPPFLPPPPPNIADPQVPQYFQNLRRLIVRALETEVGSPDDFADTLIVQLAVQYPACHWAVLVWTEDFLEDWSLPGIFHGVLVPEECQAAVPPNLAAFETGGIVYQPVHAVLFPAEVQVIAFFKPTREPLSRFQLAIEGQYVLRASRAFDVCVADACRSVFIDNTEVAQCVQRNLAAAGFGGERGVGVISVSAAEIGFRTPAGGLMELCVAFELPEIYGDGRVCLYILPPRM